MAPWLMHACYAWLGNVLGMQAYAFNMHHRWCMHSMIVHQGWCMHSTVMHQGWCIHSMVMHQGWCMYILWSCVRVGACIHGHGSGLVHAFYGHPP